MKNKTERTPIPIKRFQGGIGVIEKPKNLKKTWLKIIKYANPFLKIIVLAIFLAFLGTLFQIIGPNKLRDITNEIIKGLPTIKNEQLIIGQINLKAITKIAWFLLFLYGGSGLLNFIQSYMMATVTQNLTKQMRHDISLKINRLPFKYYDKTSYGDIISRITNDVDAIGQTMNQSVATLFTSLTMLIGSLIMMFYNSFLLTIISVITSLIGFLFMKIIISKSQKYFIEQQKNLGEVNGYIEEIFSAHHIVKVYNGSAEAKRTFENINNKLYNSAWKAEFLSSLMHPLMHFVGNLGYVLVCVIGAILAMNNVITFGVIVAFLIYIRLFTQPLSQLAQVMNNFQRAAAAGERVFEFLEEKELEKENYKTLRLKNIQGKVQFKNVKFGYTDDVIIIPNFSVKIKPGQKVAIVGPTGAGKTTIVNLLMRFYEVNDGEILIDDLPLSLVPRENVHDQFSMVLQDTWLFEGTIKENIIFNKNNITEEKVIETCKIVGLHHFIQTLPNGYNTILDDKTTLSEGQKQLITIARAMIQNAPLLILDEATSSVDTKTERTVQLAMDKLTKGRTSFVIAHRLSTIKNADLILVMKEGNIIEKGNHQELLEQKGFYHELYYSQFEETFS
ncbi:MAG: ABC transporter ATP-binding protein [Bacilli bacterium]|jgi:ATP-binding cassette subfamily B multidrug efflux pump